MHYVHQLNQLRCRVGVDEKPHLIFHKIKIIFLKIFHLKIPVIKFFDIKFFIYNIEFKLLIQD